ncbi:MAG: hypothetical protein WCP28_21245 [Actinomycetes bacterium]
MPKRLDDVAQPAAAGQWRIRFGTSDAASNWTELVNHYSNTVREAWERMRLHPLERTDTQKPLAGSLGSRRVGGIDLPQWQFDISSGARLWYCVDEDARTVWVMLASTGHPGATVSKGKRSSLNR